jgi:uncharacterized protein YegP (UPF0339 family)
MAMNEEGCMTEDKFKFVIVKSALAEYIVRFEASGGQTLMSRAYGSKDAAEGAISIIKEHAAAAEIEDRCQPTGE